MVKRLFLFFLVNILVLVTISLTLNILGVRPYLNAYGLDYYALLAFCAVCGFVGALFSLLTSRFMAKTFMGVRVINPQTTGSAEESRVLQTVYRLAQRAHLPVMPEVGIYESPEVNAFATGPSKSRSLVAVSSGLLDRMDESAVEGVLAHEITHVSNGDMVTMALIQGVVNTFVMFFARIIAWGVSNAIAGNRDDENRGGGMGLYFINMIAIFVFEVLFSLLGTIVVAFFSRGREFRADKGGAQLAGREKMIHALESLKGTMELTDNRHPSVQALKISGRPSGLMALLASHPDLEVRINALKQLA